MCVRGAWRDIRGACSVPPSSVRRVYPPLERHFSIGSRRGRDGTPIERDTCPVLLEHRNNRRARFCRHEDETVVHGWTRYVGPEEEDGRPLSLGSLRGVPMVASSPVRHEGSDSPQPLEVHAYQPPWKALAEYAMHPNEVDPTTPHFQHLVNQARI
ncbi:hypothetical protein MRX96_022951 [Rhipicephalus microplus]